MEILAGATVGQSLSMLVSMSTTSSKDQEITEPKLLMLFNEMKTRMGLDKSDISLKSNSEINSICATGSLLFGCKGVVVMNSSDYFKGKSDATISAVFAHELSHLKNYDSTRLPAFVFLVQLISGVALMILFSTPVLPAFLISFALTAATSFFAFLPYIEMQAEESMGDSLNDKELALYIEYQKKQLQTAINIRANLDYSFFDRMRYSEEGNIRTDFTHPCRTSVVAMLEKKLAARRVATISV